MTTYFIARSTRTSPFTRFGKIDGRWYFIDGNTPKSKPAVRQSHKIGRNAPCPCGSGKKYKKCCGQ